MWGEGECILNISLSLMHVSALRLNGFSGVASYDGLAGGRALMGGSYGINIAVIWMFRGGGLVMVQSERALSSGVYPNVKLQ